MTALRKRSEESLEANLDTAEVASSWVKSCLFIEDHDDLEEVESR